MNYLFKNQLKMNVLSCLKSQGLPSKILQHPGRFIILRNFSQSTVKNGGHGPATMKIQSSRYVWNQFKDHLHFYIFLGVIPLSAIVFYTNVFIGPAKLSLTPEGYKPKIEEYYKHPITRFLAKHFGRTHQETYERNLHYLKLREEKIKMRKLTRKVDQLMEERGDSFMIVSQANYAPYTREVLQDHEQIKFNMGNK